MRSEVLEPVSGAPSLLVFDLDGTLIDSSVDLCSSVNAALLDVQLAPLSHAEISDFIGDGAATLVRRALSFRLGSPSPLDDGVLFERAYSFFLAHYRVHKLDHTRPYPGVLDTLEVIRHVLPDLPMAILTNKPVRPSREICDGLGLSPYFFANYGGDSFPTKKPAPGGLQAIVREAWERFGSPTWADMPTYVTKAFMIGDSPADVEAGRACGLGTIGCRYGLAPEALLATRPDLVIEAPGDLLEALSLRR